MKWAWICGAVAVAALAGFAWTGAGADAAEQADDEKEALKVGDEAPDFELPKRSDAEDEAGSPKKLSDFRGKKNVLLAFYPRVFTGGCTAQLCGYRDDFSQFTSADTEVVAISTDPQNESDRFRTEHQMPFFVLGDPEAEVVRNYGVPLRERGDMSFAQRSVFLVDKEGIIRHIDMEYDIAADKEPLYEQIAKLNTPAAS